MQIVIIPRRPSNADREAELTQRLRDIERRLTVLEEAAKGKRRLRQHQRAAQFATRRYKHLTAGTVLAAKNKTNGGK